MVGVPAEQLSAVLGCCFSFFFQPIVTLPILVIDGLPNLSLCNLLPPPACLFRVLLWKSIVVCSLYILSLNSLVRHWSPMSLFL